MKIYSHIKEVPTFPFAVVAMGYFDGLHVGHRALLQQAYNYAQKHKGQLIVLCFTKSPQGILYGSDSDHKTLLTKDEKEQVFSNLGIDILVYQDFTIGFANTDKQTFVEQYLIKQLSAKAIFVGYAQHFGYAKEGNYLWLNKMAKQWDIEVIGVAMENYQEQEVNSNRIHHHIHKGELQLANQLIGSPYCLCGKVVSGNKIGRQLGFPTANIELSEEYNPKLLPTGVYVASIEIDGNSYQAMLNIGYRPSIKLAKHELRVETHIFKFNKTIYGKPIKIFLLKRLRNEKHFEHIDELITQLQKDREDSLFYFNKS